MRAPHKIAWVSLVGEKGGAEVLMLNSIRGLDRQHFTPTVILLRPGPLEAELSGLGIETFRVPVHRMRNAPAALLTILRIKRTIVRQGIRIIHTNAFRTHFFAGPAARLAGVPEVWTVHTREQHSWFNRLIWKMPASEIISNCPRTSDFFTSVGCPNEMIWPGVDCDRLDHATARSELMARYQLPANARWISMAARLQRYKGQMYFLRGLAAIAGTTPDVHGIVIGAGLFEMERHFLAELKQEAARLGISNRVLFTGFIPDADVAGFFAASEVVVHPALDEDFGLSVAEAQALGKPVVAFAAVGPSAIIVDGETGRLVPIGNQEELDKALTTTLADPDAIARMAKAARARARALFGVETHVRRTEAIYHRCIERGRRQFT